MNRLTPIIAASVLAVLAAVLVCGADDSSAESVLSGTLTDTIDYDVSLDEDGGYTLSLSGTGSTPTYTTSSHAPWSDLTLYTTYLGSSGGDEPSTTESINMEWMCYLLLVFAIILYAAMILTRGTVTGLPFLTMLISALGMFSFVSLGDFGAGFLICVLPLFYIFMVCLLQWMRRGV